MRKPTCAWCRFWLVMIPGTATVQAIGTCKRFPPTPAGGGQALPQMVELDWCGEHQPIEGEG